MDEKIILEVFLRKQSLTILIWLLLLGIGRSERTF